MRSTARGLLHGLLLAATIVALAPTAQAQYFGRNKVRYDSFDFRILETEHFDLYYYEGMEQSAPDVARMAERWYDRLSTILGHEFEDRKSIVLYADDADFRQTNIANIGEGTQGVTEGARLRVVLPVASSYAETDHVLGHELVHQFQYDIARTSGRFAQFVRLPLFLIEGMAEYYSVGREDALTAMWMRDACLRDDFPTVGELQTSGRYNEYQYGQPFWAYVGGTYGDEAGVRLFRSALDMPLDSAIVAVTGVRPDTLSARWEQSLRATLVPPAKGRSAPRPPRTPEELNDIAEERRERAQAIADGERPGPPRYLAYPDSLPDIDATRLLARERETGGINIAPQLSPDGRYVAYLSELDLFGIDLFLADAETGEVITKLESVGTNSHFDAIRFIESAGTWSPDGSRFAYVVFAGGDNEIAVLDVNRRNVVQRLTVEGIGAIKDPAWSPDGSRIAFAGVQGGISDLYTVEIGGANDGRVTQLTNDRYADLQPAWSPDGTQIAFVTDRGPQTDFVRLTYSPMQIALYNVETADIEALDLFDDVKHINPAWSPDGASLYFISDRAGFNDVYRYDVATGGRYQVTNLATGVAGIADLSPALSVADDTGALAYSVFEAQRYSVYRTPAEEAVGTLVEDEPDTVVADILPPVSAIGTSSIQDYLADATTGLPQAQTFPTRGYSPRLSLEYISQPQVGVGYDSYYNSGFGVAGGISFLFADQLSDNLVGVSVAANGTFKDIGGQGLYLNRGRRMNYGAIVGHVPFLQVLFGRAPESEGSYFTRLYYRTYITQVGGLTSYPLNQSQRLEANVGYRRYGFDLEYDALQLTSGGFAIFEGRRNFEGFDPDPLHLAEAGAAFVGDASYFGFVSPIRGYRYRFGVDGTVGSLDYATVTADARRYQMVRPGGFPRRVPLTFAVRATHFGRYGTDADNFRLNPIYIGFGQYVRGYSFNSFESNQAFGSFQDRLLGSRMAIASAEMRLPLLGVPQLGLISFPYLPTELTFFADAGIAWGPISSQFSTFGGQTQPGLSPVDTYGRSLSEQKPVFSAGVSARISVLGALVVEPYYALPFSRWGADGDLPSGRGVFGLNLTPGW